MRRTFVYNDRGDMVRETIEQRAFDEALEAWSQGFAHEYDEAGNWTHRNMETVLHDGSRRLHRVETRELAYF